MLGLLDAGKRELISSCLVPTFNPKFPQIEGSEKLIAHVKTDFHAVQFKKHQDVTLDIPKPKPKPRDESGFPPPTSAEKERRVLEEANKIAGMGRRERDRPPSPPPEEEEPQFGRRENRDNFEFTPWAPPDAASIGGATVDRGRLREGKGKDDEFQFTPWGAPDANAFRSSGSVWDKRRGDDREEFTPWAAPETSSSSSSRRAVEERELERRERQRRAERDERQRRANSNNWNSMYMPGEKPYSPPPADNDDFQGYESPPGGGGYDDDDYVAVGEDGGMEVSPEPPPRHHHQLHQPVVRPVMAEGAWETMPSLPKPVPTQDREEFSPWAAPESSSLSSSRRAVEERELERRERQRRAERDERQRPPNMEPPPMEPPRLLGSPVMESRMSPAPVSPAPVPPPPAMPMPVPPPSEDAWRLPSSKGPTLSAESLRQLPSAISMRDKVSYALEKNAASNAPDMSGWAKTREDRGEMIGGKASGDGRISGGEEDCEGGDKTPVWNEEMEKRVRPHSKSKPKVGGAFDIDPNTSFIDTDFAQKTLSGGGKAEKQQAPPPAKGLMIKSATQLNREAEVKTEEEKVKEGFNNILNDVIKKLSQNQQQQKEQGVPAAYNSLQLPSVGGFEEETTNLDEDDAVLQIVSELDADMAEGDKLARAREKLTKYLTMKKAKREMALRQQQQPHPLHHQPQPAWDRVNFPRSGVPSPPPGMRPHARQQRQNITDHDISSFMSEWGVGGVGRGVGGGPC